MVGRALSSGDNGADGLRLFARLSSRAIEVAEEAAVRGDELNIIQTFERALGGINCTREEVLSLWVTLEAALHVTRRAGQYYMPPRPVEEQYHQP